MSKGNKPHKRLVYVRGKDRKTVGVFFQNEGKNGPYETFVPNGKDRDNQYDMPMKDALFLFLTTEDKKERGAFYVNDNKSKEERESSQKSSKKDDDWGDDGDDW